MMTRRCLAAASVVCFLVPLTVMAQETAAPWELSIQEFERQDQEKMPPEDAVLFVGSSSIRFWDLPAHFPSLPAINRGFGGSQVADVTRYVDRIVAPYRPRALVFYSGDNDIAQGNSPEQVFQDYTAFVQGVHEVLPETPVYVLAIKPSPSRWHYWDAMRSVNRALEHYAERSPLVTYVDVASPMLDAYGRPRKELFQSDLLHLNTQGYALWTSLLTPHLRVPAGDTIEGDVVVVTPGASVVVLDKAPIEPERRYALAWDMKVLGEKRWRFVADFAGVIVTFYSADGRSLNTVRRHTHCWQTLDWQPAWILLQSPRNAAYVSATVAIQADASLPGEFQIRNVSVDDVDTGTPAAGHGRVHIRVTDGDGNLTPARIYVRNDAGDYLAPSYAFTAELGGVCFYFQDPDVNAIELPPGSYTIRAMKGFEHGPAEAVVEVTDGESQTAELVLSAVTDYPGWVAGDHQVHLFRHGSSVHPMINLDDVYTIAKAEGLQYLPFMGQDKVDELDHVEPGFLAMVTEEYTRDLWGHLCPIGVRARPRMVQYGEVWPMNFYFIAAAEKAGGAMAYAHPYGPLIDGLETYYLENRAVGRHIAREFPIDVALGQHCTLDILTKEDAAGDFDVKVRDYMRLLTLGFRVGATGSTDFHVDQARQPIGGLRTYAQAGSLTWNTIAAAYREGRTFATNGPLVALTINGKSIGDTVELGTPRDVACAVRAESLWGLEKVELWHNGSVIAEVDAVEGRVDETVAVRVEASGWILAIAKGPAEPEVMTAPEGNPMVQGQYAITSPVYITVAGRPAPVDPNDVAYFVAWVDAVAEAVQREIAALEETGQTVPQEVRETISAKLLGARSAFSRIGGVGGSRLKRIPRPTGIQP
jgi:lysophospholipase L1-like esterase